MLETLCRHLDMVRLSAAGVLMIALVGCVGLIDGGSDGMTDEQRDARAKWQNDALPVLRTNCMSCHNGSRPMVGFLMGTEDFEIHDKLVKFEPPVVNLEAVSSSRILTKGLHDGPILTAEQSSALLTWLQAERQFANNDPDNPIIQIATKKVQVQLCTGGDPDNAAGTCPTTHIPLEKVPTDGTTLGGAEISFVAQGLQSGLYLTRLAVNGGTTGVYLEHALFVSLPASPAQPFPDQIDRYFALKMNVPAGMTTPISGGTDLFFGFASTDSIEIHFKKLGVFQPDTNQPKNDGCKMLAQFKANAVAQLNTNCASCHQGNANATAKAAMDVTGLGAADDPTVLLACNQVRSRINLTNTDQSGFYLAPNPAAGGNHPFKFANNQAAFNAFKTAMDVWVKAEQTAP